MIDIVVNYRTADEPLAALLIDRALAKRIGGRVFRDYSSIRPGQRYSSRIWTAIDQCQIFVAVIGSRWLEKDDDGRRRIDDPADFVRREIARALQRGIPVVPVLIGKASLPKQEDLPEDLRGLPAHQYRCIRIRGAEHEVERLADELVALLDDDPSTGEETGTPAAGARPSSTVTNVFEGTVHAEGAVFGVVNHGR
ncbi:toll/interleukin-1 receptor domain-containing protein [Dactylosporangium sp. NPDC000521]|uniref:toll/interleukin-1 receptor domain-containing protein n=1 Tax=Dactylosporangium sp. NPDC000521 TaxID=3363975 RepID=UPI00369E737C